MKVYPEDEVARIEAIIENAFEFVRDVIEDPSVLDRLPNGSEIELTPLASGSAFGREVARTRRFSISLASSPTSGCPGFDED